MAVIATSHVAVTRNLPWAVPAAISASARSPPNRQHPQGSSVQYRPTRTELAQLINQARLDRHLSIRSAARIAGVPAATVQGWLAGRHFPTPALRPKFLLLVEALGLEEHLHPALWLDETN